MAVNVRRALNMLPGGSLLEALKLASVQQELANSEPVDTIGLSIGKKLVRFWHLCSAATSMTDYARQATRGLHCSRKASVAGNFLPRAGQVALTRLREPGVPGELGLRTPPVRSVPEPKPSRGHTAAIRLRADATVFVQLLVPAGSRTTPCWSCPMSARNYAPPTW